VTIGAKDSSDVWQPAFNLAYGLETIDGLKMLYPWFFHEYWRQVIWPIYEGAKDPLTRGFMDRYGSRMFAFSRGNVDQTIVRPLPYNLDLLSLANVRYIISNRRIDDSRLELLPTVYSQAQFDRWTQASLWGKARGVLAEKDYIAERIMIYENTQALERVFFTTGHRVFSRKTDLYSALQTNNLDTLRRTVYLNQEDVGLLADNNKMIRADATVSLLDYGLEECRASVRSSQNGWVVFTNTLSTFWRCRVDGKEQPVVAAYGTFMAVQVAAGDHIVEFLYEPPYRNWVRFFYP
jgi:hypothetical protein